MVASLCSQLFICQRFKPSTGQKHRVPPCRVHSASPVLAEVISLPPCLRTVLSQYGHERALATLKCSPGSSRSRHAVRFKSMRIVQRKLSRRRRCNPPFKVALAGFGVLMHTAAGCAKVPDGAKFEVTRGPFPHGLIFFFLTDQKLTLPWVPLSANGQYKWCFANLGFSGSHAQVLLEIVGTQPFDPRNAGGIVGLSIADSEGKVIYRSEGPLHDSENVTGQGNRWVSEYFHYSNGPATDLKSAYMGSSELYASVSSFGSYCTELSITGTSALADSKARVFLQSGWK
jgi:hypothetical protein